MEARNADMGRYRAKQMRMQLRAAAAAGGGGGQPRARAAGARGPRARDRERAGREGSASSRRGCSTGASATRPRSSPRAPTSSRRARRRWPTSRSSSTASWRSWCTSRPRTRAGRRARGTRSSDGRRPLRPDHVRRAGRARAVPASAQGAPRGEPQGGVGGARPRVLGLPHGGRLWQLHEARREAGRRRQDHLAGEGGGDAPRERRRGARRGGRRVQPRAHRGGRARLRRRRACDGALFTSQLGKLYEDPSKRSWFKLFRHMDDDDSGRITYAELAGLVREELKLSPRELPEVSLKAVWAALDRDGSGFLNAGEFGAFMRRGEREGAEGEKPPPPSGFDELIRPAHLEERRQLNRRLRQSLEEGTAASVRPSRAARRAHARGAREGGQARVGPRRGTRRLRAPARRALLPLGHAAAAAPAHLAHDAARRDARGRIAGAPAPAERAPVLGGGGRRRRRGRAVGRTAERDDAAAAAPAHLAVGARAESAAALDLRDYGGAATARRPPSPRRAPRALLPPAQRLVPFVRRACRQLGQFSHHGRFDAQGGSQPGSVFDQAASASRLAASVYPHHPSAEVPKVLGAL